MTGVEYVYRGLFYLEKIKQVLTYHHLDGRLLSLNGQRLYCLISAKPADTASPSFSVVQPGEKDTQNFAIRIYLHLCLTRSESSSSWTPIAT